VAVSVSGESVIYNGREWRLAGSVGPAASYRLSCPTTTFCAAVGANGLPGKPSTISTFNGTTWSSTQTSTTGATDDRLLGVSCASPVFCVAVNLNGEIRSFNGSRWSVSDKAGPALLTTVSCATASFCVAVAETGRSIAFNGTRWLPPQTIPDFQNSLAYSVSCASATSCVVVGLSGSAASWIDGRWQHPVTAFPGGYVAGTDVACTRSERCMAVDARGESVLN
jgi:hypothetical protein